ncbi:MAG: phosphate ABC transporter permease PstA [Pseudomonadota bacterium]
MNKLGRLHMHDRNRAIRNRRYRFEILFRFAGIAAICVALSMLLLIMVSIITAGSTGFLRTDISLEVDLTEVPADLTPEQRYQINWLGISRAALRQHFPEVTTRSERKKLYKLLSSGAGYELQAMVEDRPELAGTVRRVKLPASSDVDLLLKGKIDRTVDASLRTLDDQQIGWVDQLDAKALLETRFNWQFFVKGDSRLPELAGIWGGIVGSFWMLLITLVISLPLGLLTSVYLEEYAKPGRWMRLIETNINNLAAVPSIVFGLLGLVLFLNIADMPRSAPITGALVLTLMTLPTIVIAARAALSAIPPSIREAAYGLGASRTQVVLHHLIPLSLPGTLTGTIIGMAQALGETAPLLMIGMVAFILEPSFSPVEASTALPVQIFLWADNPERGFVEKTSAAIMVLILFLILMNMAALLLRRKTRKNW